MTYLCLWLCFGGDSIELMDDFFDGKYFMELGVAIRRFGILIKFLFLCFWNIKDGYGAVGVLVDFIVFVIIGRIFFIESNYQGLQKIILAF